MADVKTKTMNKIEAEKKRAEWLAYCLSIGWSKDDLDGLSKAWDTVYDENGNRRPPEPPPPVNGFTQEQILHKWTNCYDVYSGEETRNMIAAMDQWERQQTSLLREENKRLREELRELLYWYNEVSSGRTAKNYDVEETVKSLLQSNIDIQNDKKETT